MQNKTKLFLILMVVFIFGFLTDGKVWAETTTPWCCVPSSGNGCVDSDSSSGCQAGYSAKTTGACSTISGCSQYVAPTTTPTPSPTTSPSPSPASTGPIIPTELAGLPTNPNLVKGIFTNVANFLLSIIGIIAIISFVISGIQYFLVATDEKMMETAKKTMVASIIGLVVALFGYIAVKTVEMLLKGG